MDGGIAGGGGWTACVIVVFCAPYTMLYMICGWKVIDFFASAANLGVALSKYGQIVKLE